MCWSLPAHNFAGKWANELTELIAGSCEGLNVEGLFPLLCFEVFPTRISLLRGTRKWNVLGDNSQLAKHLCLTSMSSFF